LEPRNSGKTRGSQFVIAGFVPAISIRRTPCPNYRDGRDEPGHNQIGTAMSFAAVTEPPNMTLIPLYVFGVVRFAKITKIVAFETIWQRCDELN
jgi:hypothetical protein